MIQALFS